MKALRARIPHLLVVLAATGVAGGAVAQPKPVRPGLWEMKVQNPELDAARAQMEQQFAQMPPAMRKQMEQMMASRGIGLDSKGAIKACITPEQARRGPTMQEEGCKQSFTWSGKVGRFEMQCEDGRKGHGEVTYVDDTAWQGWGEFSDPKRGAKVMKFDYSGHWLGADCGGIKPVRMR